jgi:hypothetical protein
MRTFPKALSILRQIVNERGEQLRKLSFAELKRIGDSQDVENLTVESRPATIGILVLPLPSSGGISVVVQGFMKARLIGNHVALDGFYKYPDDSITAMPDEDFWQFD